VALANAKPQPTRKGSSGTISQATSPEQERKSLPPQRPSISIPSDILEPTIMNVQPHEELTRFISDFIFLSLDAGENLEVSLFKNCGNVD
jgi:hypothetical protein